MVPVIGWASEPFLPVYTVILGLIIKGSNVDSANIRKQTMFIWIIHYNSQTSVVVVVVVVVVV